MTTSALEAKEVRREASEREAGGKDGGREGGSAMGFGSTEPGVSFDPFSLEGK